MKNEPNNKPQKKNDSSPKVGAVVYVKYKSWWFTDQPNPYGKLIEKLYVEGVVVSSTKTRIRIRFEVLGNDPVEAKPSFYDESCVLKLPKDGIILNRSLMNEYEFNKKVSKKPSEKKTPAKEKTTPERKKSEVKKKPVKPVKQENTQKTAAPSTTPKKRKSTGSGDQALGEYPYGFKKLIVEQVVTLLKPQAQVAREFQISTNSVSKWVKMAKEGTLLPPPPPPPSKKEDPAKKKKGPPSTPAKPKESGPEPGSREDLTRKFKHINKYLPKEKMVRLVQEFIPSVPYQQLSFVLLFLGENVAAKGRFLKSLDSLFKASQLEASKRKEAEASRKNSKQKIIIGKTQIWKAFGEDARLYKGTVDSFCMPFYKIRYEDGDEEEMLPSEVLKLIIPDETEEETNTPTPVKVEEAKMGPQQKTTPSKEEAGGKKTPEKSTNSTEEEGRKELPQKQEIASAEAAGKTEDTQPGEATSMDALTAGSENLSAVEALATSEGAGAAAAEVDEAMTADTVVLGSQTIGAGEEVNTAENTTVEDTSAMSPKPQAQPVSDDNQAPHAQPISEDSQAPAMSSEPQAQPVSEFRQDPVMMSTEDTAAPILQTGTQAPSAVPDLQSNPQACATAPEIQNSMQYQSSSAAPAFQRPMGMVPGYPGGLHPAIVVPTYQGQMQPVHAAQMMSRGGHPVPATMAPQFHSGMQMHAAANMGHHMPIFAPQDAAQSRVQEGQSAEDILVEFAELATTNQFFHHNP